MLNTQYGQDCVKLGSLHPFPFNTLSAVSTPSTSHTCLSISIKDKPSGYAYLTKVDILGRIFLGAKMPIFVWMDFQNYLHYFSPDHPCPSKQFLKSPQGTNATKAPFTIGNLVVDFLFWRLREFSNIHEEHSVLGGARKWSWTCLTYYCRVTVSQFKKKKKDCASRLQCNTHLNIDNLK